MIPNNNNQDPGKMEVACPTCSQKFSQSLPHAEFSNNFRSSVIVATHENVFRCPNNKCRQPFIFVIQGAQLIFNCQPVGDEVVQQLEGSKIIKPHLNIVGGVN